MNRFREGGLQSLKMIDAKCEDGITRPFVVSKYKRVKNRNATNPSRLSDEFELVIPCLCDKEHDPIDIEWDNEGNPVGAVNGNMHCWYGLFDYLTKDLQDQTQKLIQNFNITERKFSSKQNRSNKKIKKTISNWCKMCGVFRCSFDNHHKSIDTDQPSANNCWARKTLINSTNARITSQGARMHQILALITRGLDECQLNANRIMAISGHRSEKQMRKDYNGIKFSLGWV